MLHEHNAQLKDVRNRETIIKLPQEDTLTINVISEMNRNYKIKDTKVTLTYYLKEKIYKFEQLTDTFGNCSFIIPSCTEFVELYGEKRSYLPDSLLKTEYQIVKNDIQKRTLILKPKIYDLDIVMCIDATGSMGHLLRKLK